MYFYGILQNIPDTYKTTQGIVIVKAMNTENRNIPNWEKWLLFDFLKRYFASVCSNEPAPIEEAHGHCNSVVLVYLINNPKWIELLTVYVPIR